MAPKPTTTLTPHQVLQLTYVCRAMTKGPDIDYEVFGQLGGYSSAFNARKSFHALMRAVMARGDEGPKAGKGKKRKAQKMDDDNEGEQGEEGATVAKKQKGVSAEKGGMGEIVQA
nr:hypothetical protein B0A51_06586 [Rachicladosporium sp. CCFEE 5018]